MTSIEKLKELKVQLKALEHLRDRVQAFKDHGEAKLGTHGRLMFEALAVCKKFSRNESS